MNIEDYREYCLSLGADVEEKLPFQKFKSGEVFMWKCFGFLQVTETQEETQYSQN